MHADPPFGMGEGGEGAMERRHCCGKKLGPGSLELKPQSCETANRVDRE